jgi:MFS family permease
LSHSLGTAIGTKVPACAGAATTFWEKTLGTLTALTATNCEWTQFDLGWMYTLFFVLLGSAAAIWGGWLERTGPRKAGVYAALCWCGGLMISAIGVRTHQLWMLWIGSGVIGGIGMTRVWPKAFRAIMSTTRFFTFSPPSSSPGSFATR